MILTDDVIRVAPRAVQELDPYELMALLGKRYVHPGGRRATEQLLAWADIGAGQQVLDIGCGSGTTAVRIARSHGAQVTAADISQLMLGLARRAVDRAGVSGLVGVEWADITALPYPDGAFDRVIAEAVTMFVRRRVAARELVRVCRPGGRVLATEFFWRRPPTDEARRIFLGEVCPGLRFDSVQDWVEVYEDAGLSDVRTTVGPFEMLTVPGFLDDEGVRGMLAFAARSMSRKVYLRRLAWLMPRMARAVPYLGYIAVVGTRPAESGDGAGDPGR
ncbi:MAG: methyltransferase domain-containing protein [Actinobacteria bacterium]|nr:methyltransferase domain-containing protein [Actinomycetota bacterium]